MIHELDSSPMIFTNDVVMSENHWMTASGQNIVIHGKPYIVLFFHTIWGSEPTNPMKTNIWIAHFAIVTKDGLL